MAYIAKLSNSGGVKSLTRYVSALAGNEAYVENSYESIASSTVSGTTTGSVTFSSIPQTYSHLQLRVFARTLTVATTEAMYLYNFNNNSGSTGSSTHYLTGDGATVYVGANLNQYSSYLGTMPAASALASTFGVSITDVLDYTNTNKNKTLRTLFGYDRNGAGELGLVGNVPLTLPGTAAVTTLTVALTGGNYFAAGSNMALYGIRG
jgi:hypothetical protein